MRRSRLAPLGVLLAFACASARADVEAVGLRHWYARPAGNENLITGLFCPMSVRGMGKFELDFTNYDKDEHPTCVYSFECSAEPDCKGANEALELTIVRRPDALEKAFRSQLPTASTVSVQTLWWADRILVATLPDGRREGLWMKRGRLGWFAATMRYPTAPGFDPAQYLVQLMSWEFPPAHRR
jgi:hypothetical protein